jgi:eukaryotic-like serine/threonine-protein kinase
MSANEWERVRALFQSALEQPDERRAVFLSDACQGDESIQREIESLIAAHAAAVGFLEAPAFRVTTEVAVAPALQPGDRIGSFEVVGVL